MFRVIHNGYNIKHFESDKQIEDFINEELEPHRNLSPKMIKNVRLDMDTHLIVYQYYTLYCEIFMIVRED